MYPLKGYIPKIRKMGVLSAAIYTFGFGYNIRLGLLKSITKVGSGNCLFIPNAGMIGHWVISSVSPPSSEPIAQQACRLFKLIMRHSDRIRLRIALEYLCLWIRAYAPMHL
jgi:hypothetical protein